MWSRANANSRIKTIPSQSTKKLSLPSKPTQTRPAATASNTEFHGTASIFDLQPKDKSKIKNLIRKVVALDTECKTTEEKAKENQRKLKKQVTALKSQNHQIIKQHSKLRCKFQQSLKLLQSYQVKITQMDTAECGSDFKHRKPSAEEKEREKYAQQIQTEISDLKQLILELHQKEKRKERERVRERPPPPRPIPQMSQSATASMLYHGNAKHTAADSFLDVDDNDDDDDGDEESSDLQNISPIQTPRSHERPPAPHPYPVKKKTKMTLAQLRKYSLPSSSSTSPSPPPKEIRRKAKPATKPSTMGKERLSQLLRIQSGNFKRTTTAKTEAKQTQRTSVVTAKKCGCPNMQTSASLMHFDRKRERGHTERDGPRDLRRVQSEKAMERTCRGGDGFDVSDDETDRLSHYEGMDLGLSFPKTDDEFSDEEDELILIQHLNVLPR